MMRTPAFLDSQVQRLKPHWGKLLGPTWSPFVFATSILSARKG